MTYGIYRRSHNNQQKQIIIRQYLAIATGNTARNINKLQCKNGDTIYELLTGNFVIMPMTGNDYWYYDTIYGPVESRRFLRGLYAVCFCVAAGWGLLFVNTVKKPRYGQLRPSLLVKLPSTNPPNKEAEKIIPSTRAHPEPIAPTKESNTSDTVALRQIDNAPSPPSFSSQQLIETHVKDLVNNTEFSHQAERRDERTDDLVFDPRIQKKLDQASMRTTRARTHRSVHEEYSDISGNMVRRDGNTCAKNNQELADQMGIDALFFVGSCNTKHYDIELNINLNTELHR